MMVNQDDIRLLREITARQRDELMGISTPASASVSDTEESGAAPESPSNTDGGFSSGLDASP
jgi:hypothetical protein